MTQLHGYGYDKGSSLAVQGIKFVYELSKKEDEFGTISVSISPYNFERSFELYLELTQNCLDSCATWIHLRLKDNFVYTTADEDCAALLLEAPTWFSLSKSRVGSFDSSKLGLHFGIYDNGDARMHDYVLGIGYTPANIKAPSITALVDKLYELNLIHKKWEEQ